MPARRHAATGRIVLDGTVRGEIHGFVSGTVHAVVDGSVNVNLISGTASEEDGNESEI